MSLAKAVGQRPRDVAEKIKSHLDLGQMVQNRDKDITIAGPGFINVKLSYAWLAEELQKLLPDPRLGVDSVATPQTVVVDYSGPNVAKEMHVGHLRSTIIGDAISRVLEFQGHKIIRQNHIGDWGTQFGMLCEYLIERIGLEAIRHKSITIDDLNGFYQAGKAKFDSDPDFAKRSRERVVKLQGGDVDTLEAWKKLRDESLKHFHAIYGYSKDGDEIDTRTTYDLGLGVKLTDHDIVGESFYNTMLPSVVADLKEKHLAEVSDGATVVFIDGPEKPPIIIEKSGGGYLYSTTDLAAIRYRTTILKANRIIYVHDSRQAHHFAQLFATAQKAGWADGVTLEFAPFGTMLGEDGKPFKTRSGETVKLKDLLHEAELRGLKVVKEKNVGFPPEQGSAIAHAVGIGGVKYSDLAKDRVADYFFSFDKMLSMDGNTAPYLQYAHARIRSIFRKTTEIPGKITLQSPYELSLAKHILRFGEVLELVARDLKPHILCGYLYDLATKFSGFYENCPVIQSDPETRASRLALCDLTAKTMAKGLDLLGIEHPDQM